MLMIDAYDFGKIIIDGKAYSDDVRVVRGKVLPDWWRKEGHYLQVADLKEVFAAKPKTLIVGTGYSGVMKVAPEVRKECKKRGIKLIEMLTADAVKRYNELAGPEVAGAFHLTC